MSWQGELYKVVYNMLFCNMFLCYMWLAGLAVSVK
jgi:hypothetical protein